MNHHALVVSLPVLLSAASMPTTVVCWGSTLDDFKIVRVAGEHATDLSGYGLDVSF
jgi:hypothetical protein